VSADQPKPALRPLSEIGVRNSAERTKTHSQIRAVLIATLTAAQDHAPDHFARLVAMGLNRHLAETQASLVGYL
jgi:hypothetical protein